LARFVQKASALVEVPSKGSEAEPRVLVETAEVVEAIMGILAVNGSGVEGFLEEVAFSLDGFSGAGGRTGFSSGGLDGVTGSSPGRDCFCCSGVSAEQEWEIEVMAESRRPETLVVLGLSGSDGSKLTDLWLRYSQRSEVGLYLTDLS
jgi:hypothetical protein